MSSRGHREVHIYMVSLSIVYEVLDALRRWSVVSVVILALLPVIFLQGGYLQAGSSSVEETKQKCVVRPTFLTPKDYDAPEVTFEIPDHVRDFERRGIKLPKYKSSDLLLVSVSSNNTYERRMAQTFTFGRIFDIQFVTDDNFTFCVLCMERDVDDDCHCPEFFRPCSPHIFHRRPLGWWCATRKALAAVEIVLSKWEGEYPKWLHLLDDNTWINPISETLLVENLSPDEPYLIGDDWGGFLGGGAGVLMSRAAIKRLLGPPVDPVVTYRWPNGTHRITVETQLQSCVARMQGGDWCFFHGDWALPACLKEVGVPVIDAGMPSHGGFFSQLNHTSRENDTWFQVGKEIAPILHHTHSIALHVDPEEMYDIFYNKVAPYYRNLVEAFSLNAVS